MPKPRPLYIDKRLSQLAKDDQVKYAAFIEGITFLSWDIAWLCKTQGANVGNSSWEDICAMGKNLWQLLLAPFVRPAIDRKASHQSTPQKSAVSQTPARHIRGSTGDVPHETPPPGYFSHGTAYGFLAAAGGSQYMSSWRLQSPVKVIERVKTMLLAERTGAEWEILEGNEWEDEENEAEVTKEPKALNRFPIEETGVLVKPETNTAPQKAGNEESGRLSAEGKDKSTSGWMKLKNR